MKMGVDNTQTTDRRGKIHIHNSGVFPEEEPLMTPQGVISKRFLFLITSKILSFYLQIFPPQEGRERKKIKLKKKK